MIFRDYKCNDNKVSLLYKNMYINQNYKRKKK